MITTIICASVLLVCAIAVGLRFFKWAMKLIYDLAPYVLLFVGLFICMVALDRYEQTEKVSEGNIETVQH